MNQSERKSGQFVAPGDRLGVIEEFTPGAGTYSEQGTIYAKVTGRTLLDVLNKKVAVYPLVHAVNTPKVESTVLGQVLETRSKRAVIRISKVGNKSLSGFFTGVLYISDVSLNYVENMFSVCKTGDIMRAKVASDRDRTLHLSTTENNLGVVYAFCSKCGHSLTLKKQMMKCARCGNIEKRKATSDYGEGAI